MDKNIDKDSIKKNPNNLEKGKNYLFINHIEYFICKESLGKYYPSVSKLIVLLKYLECT